MPCIVASVNPIRSTAHLLGIETGLSGVGYQEVRGVTVSLAGERGPPPIPWLGGLIHRCSVSLSNKSHTHSLSLSLTSWPCAASFVHDAADVAPFANA